ncbi:PQQ-binding-like beta-propeller repeat protein [Natronococcus sp. A-GB7]|uniref:outer membrane protein assembly factor BamB family protein n=1 Tax=Natronococcus sp. A-GB7 TaxID=3037649 RepID=UPI00241FD580|nr:PQQ-binding-like beta-propeller repeat protein [Natronococcus sp. A-GB7]MDG5821246.1 PQQ-binding-like beta-propeller repeat protein [Natronococcus sp. A-GB7]
MESLSRRQLLGVLGASAAGLAGGGYWYVRGSDTVDCPEFLEPDREFWESTFDAWSEPVVDSTTVFVGGGAGIVQMSSGSRMFRLLALEPSGEPKWVARRELAGGIGRPRPTDDRVFASTGENTLLAFDRETGGLEWEFDAGGNVEGHMGVATLVHDDTVVASVNDPDHDELEGSNVVVGVSASEGELRWATELDAPVSNGLGLLEETVVVATRAGTLVGVDPETGDRRWEGDLEGSVDWTGSPVSFAGSGWIPREDGTVVGFDPASGTIRDRLASDRGDDERETETDGFVRAMRGSDEALYVGDLDGRVTAYDADGSERWQYDGPARIAALEAGTDAVGALDQRGVYTELEPETGDVSRAFLLVDVRDDDRCGNVPSERRFGGFATIRHTLVVTGRVMFGARTYPLPRPR